MSSINSGFIIKQRSLLQNMKYFQWLRMKYFLMRERVKYFLTTDSIMNSQISHVHHQLTCRALLQWETRSDQVTDSPPIGGKERDVSTREIIITFLLSSLLVMNSFSQFRPLWKLYKKSRLNWLGIFLLKTQEFSELVVILCLL